MQSAAIAAKNRTQDPKPVQVKNLLLSPFFECGGLPPPPPLSPIGSLLMLPVVAALPLNKHQAFKGERVLVEGEAMLKKPVPDIHRVVPDWKKAWGAKIFVEIKRNGNGKEYTKST